LRELIADAPEWLKHLINNHILFVAGNRKGRRILALLDNLDKLRAGHEDAESFKQLVVKVFDAVFEADLRRVGTEVEIEHGTKRIDIVYQNCSRQLDLFRDLKADPLIHCAYIPVECKNYSDDLSNPEIDQLVGRFDEIRGHFGFLVCNKIVDRPRLLLRCKEAAKAKRGWIIVLDRNDLEKLLVNKILSKDLVGRFLHEHFRKLVF